MKDISDIFVTIESVADIWRCTVYPADLFAPPFDHLQSAGPFHEVSIMQDSPLAIALMIAALIALVAIPMLIMPSDAEILAHLAY